MENIRLYAVLFVIVVIFAALTYLLHRVFKNKLIKYLPSMGTFVLALYQIYLARYRGYGGFEDIARILLAIMLLVGFGSSLLTAVILEFVGKGKS